METYHELLQILYLCDSSIRPTIKNSNYYMNDMLQLFFTLHDNCVQYLRQSLHSIENVVAIVSFTVEIFCFCHKNIFKLIRIFSKVQMYRYIIASSNDNACVEKRVT